MRPEHRTKTIITLLAFCLTVGFVPNPSALAQNSAQQAKPAAKQRGSLMPIIFVQGDVDEMVPVANTRLWVEKVKELNMPYEYNEMEGITHGPAINASLPSVYEFFGKHSKQTQQ